MEDVKEVKVKKSEKVHESTEEEVLPKKENYDKDKIEKLENDLKKALLESENLRNEKKKLEEKIEDLNVDVQNLAASVKLGSTNNGTFDVGDTVRWASKFGAYTFKVSYKYDKPVYNIYSLDLKFDNIPQDELEIA